MVAESSESHCAWVVGTHAGLQPLPSLCAGTSVPRAPATNASEQGKDGPIVRYPSASTSVRLPPRSGAHDNDSAACADAADALAYAGRKQWQGEPKGRAMARLTLGIDLAAVQLDERPGDVEAQPQPIAQAMQHL